MDAATRRHSALWPAFAVFLVVTVALPGTVVAQGAASVVRGTVSDSSGARLPGVTVTLSSPVLQLKQISVTSDGDGSYRFNDLPAGVYRVTFELSGFNRFVRDEPVHGSGSPRRSMRRLRWARCRRP